MAHWRNIGAVQTLAGGRAHLWNITYGNGRDVGVVVAAPNLQELGAGVELIAFDQGVFATAVGEELSTQTHYRVRIRNAGSSGIRYNLNIGDWQPDVGAQAPAAVRVSLLPPFAVGGVVTTAIAAKKRSKRGVTASSRRWRFS